MESIFEHKQMAKELLIGVINGNLYPNWFGDVSKVGDSGAAGNWQFQGWNGNVFSK